MKENIKLNFIQLSTNLLHIIVNFFQ
jgi:hypothetical protein